MAMTVDVKATSGTEGKEKPAHSARISTESGRTRAIW